MNVSLKCRCGSLRGILTDVSRSRGMRAVCYCDDCQAFAHYLGRAADVLDENAGTDILPVAPASLKMTQGIENLQCLRLTPKGTTRWYAGCCKSPIANARSARTPFNGLIHSILDYEGDGLSRDEVAGPVEMRVFGKFGIGKLPPGTPEKVSVGIMAHTIKFLLKGWLKKEYRPSPFFDAQSGQPVVDPYVLTRAEREALRPLCGPKPTRT